jgi:hypothetical protein
MIGSSTFCGTVKNECFVMIGSFNKYLSLLTRICHHHSKCPAFLSKILEAMPPIAQKGDRIYWPHF